MTNFNHFMSEKDNDSECPEADRHAWSPSSQTRRFGRDVAVEAFCKHCQQREWLVMTDKLFRTAQKQWEELN